MAVHNGLPTLRQALESILAQTFRDIEFIIVDDGSTDGSTELLSQYCSRDSRIRLLRNESRRNLPTSLNIGLRECTGPLIARIDADDVAMPDRLAAQLEFLERNPSVGVLGSNCRHIDLAGKLIGATRHPSDDARIRLWMAFWCCLVHPTTMFRRDLVEGVGGYNTELWTGQDYDLWARLLPHTRMVNLSEDLILYRVHDRSITKSLARQTVHLELMAAVHTRLMSGYLQQELSQSQAMALRGLVMADHVMDDAEISVGLPLLRQYLRQVRAREEPKIAKEFERLAAEGLLAQSFYKKRVRSRVRRHLYIKSATISPGSLVSPKGVRSTVGVLVPSAVWRVLKRGRR